MVKTYVIPSEEAIELAKRVYKFMVKHALSEERGDNDLADFLLECRDEVMSVIISSMVFTVSNIDRIPKVECMGEIDEEGSSFIIPSGNAIETEDEKKPKEKTPKYVS